MLTGINEIIELMDTTENHINPKLAADVKQEIAELVALFTEAQAADEHRLRKLRG
jgi:hypothetical protein